jgi:hypothetical protein
MALASAAGCQLLLGVEGDVPPGGGDAANDSTADASNLDAGPHGDALVDVTSGGQRSDASAMSDATNVADGPRESANAADAADEVSLAGPIVLASGQQFPLNIAVDAVNVYWTTTGAGAAILRCPLDGGCNQTPTAFAAGLSIPFGVASDSTNVYFTDQRGEVMTCPATGCPAAGPTTIQTGSQTAAGISVSATSVYWAIETGGLFVCDLAGCATQQEREVDNVRGLYVALDSQYVYVTSPDDRQVFMVPIAGWDAAAPTPTLTHEDGGEGRPHGIATYQGNVYWTDQESGLVRHCRPEYCGNASITVYAPETLASGQAAPAGIAVDSTGIYWTNNAPDAGAVMKLCHGCSGNPQVLAAGQAMPYGIALDQTAIYWTNEGDGTNGAVMMLHK